MSQDPSLPGTGGVERSVAIVYRDDGRCDNWSIEPKLPADASVLGDADGRSPGPARKPKDAAKSGDTPSGSESRNMPSDGRSAFGGCSANRRKYSSRRAHGGSCGRSEFQTGRKSRPVGGSDANVRLSVATSWERYIDN